MEQLNLFQEDTPVILYTMNVQYGYSYPEKRTVSGVDEQGAFFVIENRWRRFDPSTGEMVYTDWVSYGKIRLL